MKNSDKNRIRLSDIPKDRPFGVPDDYFARFPDRLRERIREEEEKKGKKIISMNTTRILAYAAGFILFVFASYYLVRMVINSQDENNFNTLTYSEIVEKDIESYDLDMIYDIYEDMSYESEEEAEEENYEDYMIEYLVYNDIDMDLILEEY